VNDFTQRADLAAERLGGRVLEANDDFFAPKENLLKESKPVFIEGKYTARGKWMDGWETRRRRTPGHDWCILRLGLPGRIHGIVVDTSFFTGNYPERFSLEGCDLGQRHPFRNERARLRYLKTKWMEIFPETPLKGNSQNLFPVKGSIRFTHLRLRIYPDGGVARLRIHGEAVSDLKRLARGECDLVAVENGGSAIASSDQHYGAPRNLLMPYRAKNMGDGWETKRRRGPGHDWVILKLGVPGTIHRVEVDTAHFRGNYPDSCSLDVCNAGNTNVDAATVQTLPWKEVLPLAKLKANHRHMFSKILDAGAATHVRFQIYPDGGVSRLRLFGLPNVPSNPMEGLERLNRLSNTPARKAFLDCCGSRKWAEQMSKNRPFITTTDLFAQADQIWSELAKDDWFDAFRHHPPIGGKRPAAKQSSKASQWSAKEQSTAQKAAPETLAQLTAENGAYFKKFGYVFLICASSRTSEEILEALRNRMPNDPATELRIAAEEQRKITRLRLEKLLAS
jgi:allantoicase